MCTSCSRDELLVFFTEFSKRNNTYYIAIMSSTYHIHADLLDENFLASLKMLYKGRAIEITVEAEQDETERIMANPTLAAKLERAIQNIEKGNVITFNFENFQHYSEALQNGESPDYRDFVDESSYVQRHEHHEAVSA
jgi:hypothetical protein